MRKRERERGRERTQRRRTHFHWGGDAVVTARPFLVTITSLTHHVRPRPRPPPCLDRPLRFDERDMTEKANCAPHGRRAGPADDADGDGPTPKLEQGHTPLVSSDSGRGRSPRGRREGAGASSAAGQRGNHFRLIECTLSCCSPRNLRCRWTDADGRTRRQ